MIMGGVITEYVSWRPVFYIIAGIALLPAIASVFLVPNLRPDKEGDRRVDWAGGALVTVGLILLLFVLADGVNAPNGWKTPCEWSSEVETMGEVGGCADVRVDALAGAHTQTSSPSSSYPSSSSPSSYTGNTTPRLGRRCRR
jgi:hypothetical protein